MWVFIILAMAFSVLFTWIYLHTDGNLFSAPLLHGTINLSTPLFPPVELRVGRYEGGIVWMMILYVAVATVIVIKEWVNWLSKPWSGED